METIYPGHATWKHPKTKKKNTFQILSNWLKPTVLAAWVHRLISVAIFCSCCCCCLLLSIWPVPFHSVAGQVSGPQVSAYFLNEAEHNGSQVLFCNFFRKEMVKSIEFFRLEWKAEKRLQRLNQPFAGCQLDLVCGKETKKILFFVAEGFLRILMNSAEVQSPLKREKKSQFSLNSSKAKLKQNPITHLATVFGTKKKNGFRKPTNMHDVEVIYPPKLIAWCIGKKTFFPRFLLQVTQPKN